MAHPSSSHRDNDRDTTTHRHRTSSSAHHHHRTISSTTLLLVLSLILAVLAVMLSLPSRHAASHKTATATAATEDPNGDHVGTSAGFWGYLTPKRSHALVSRESNVALREAEVARREAELLAGYPAGVPVCPPCVLEEEITPSMSLVARAAPPPPAPAVPAPATTTVVEVETAGPAWLKERMDAIVDRELKISQREKDVGLREEAIGKRESDATKREAWIMEQLLHLQPPEPIEEEIIYEPEHPRHYYGEARRASPPKMEIPVEIPSPSVPTATVIHTSTVIHTQTVLPPPANTRVAAHPKPETLVKTATGVSPGRTKEVFVEVPQPTEEVVEEEEYIEEEVYVQRPRVKTTKKWFGAPRW